MKKMLIVLCFLLTSVSSMAIGFPVNNTYVHQRMEQVRAQRMGTNAWQKEGLVGVVAPVIDREPVEVTPSSLSFIQRLGAWVVSFVNALISSR